MADLHDFIKNMSMDDIISSMQILNISVKKNDKLYMLNFNNDADFTNILVRQANGIILEKNTNKIVHYTFEKCYDCNNNDPYLEEVKKYTTELYFEGSLIKVYYYDNDWKISTSKHINAENNFWSSKKSFKMLFEEAVCYSYNIKNINEYLSILDKKSCYTFLMQHHENAVLATPSIPVVFVINEIDLSTGSLHEERPEKDFLKVSNLSIEDLKNDDRNYMVFIESEGNPVKRIKILSQKYIERKNIKGNDNNIIFTYIEYLSDKNKLEQLVKSYPDYNFRLIQDIILKNCKEIHRLYYHIHIKKMLLNVPKQYERTLCQLHGQYRKTRTPIDLQAVINKFITLDKNILKYILST